MTKNIWGGLDATLWVFVLVSCTFSPRTNSMDKQGSDLEAEEEVTCPPTRAREVHIVEIKQMKFQPHEIRIRKGDQVRWINRDITDHDVTEQKTKAWASSRLSSGQSWSIVITRSTDYYCNLHQVMRGKITVE